MTAKQRNTQSVTVTVERGLLSLAREAGINLSATLTAALDAELREYATRKWQEENTAALEALNRFHDEHGCFSDEYRTF
ncbi:type II toxin-antitoxin system CcdA family antitoxin [Salmonella enterica]|uniref:type II toxin-antitoxin system CcdA family antitoxin n=1 Tax=Salmonella enterica TaxID=28901 RepID=UPI0009ACA632|nr:type II toxin-antitoxin system CcdA family antitoxin [Salmonella enterica]EBG5027552.1 antitoxin [Salmonella enterica subsp. enterica serovar Oranienburg]EBZ1027953.1 antitoxin [Salmonella enterica subsp. enterica serovar Muenchen]ECJ2934129.1 antitoxin [Salmonella enterica subsp. enterica serovar Brazzaville]ECK2142919.1 antitoxin [Salmonella enterica subsp. enterica serovar Enteritidis]EIC0165795.1 type II toxin-antitoxin system CcdA family antitoxin [Salmonella enterica subsp. enterica s